MNCAHWEERIALFIGGDLPAEEAVQVEHHLAECLGCQVFAGGLRETLEQLQEAHVEDIAPAAYTAVRARVLAEISRPPVWRWIFGLAVAAAAAVLLAVLWIRPAKHTIASYHQAPAPRQIVTPQHAIAPPNAVLRVNHVRRRRRIAPPVVAKARLPETPLMVKLVTDDPNVVIYWITDKRGE